MKDIDKFMKELSSLTRKYGIKIDGCGCCGSPWAKRLGYQEKSAEYRYFIYDVDDFEGSIYWSDKCDL